jgi:hypothetical protein
MPGLTANVTIFTLEKNDVLAVPAKALRFMPNEALLEKDQRIEDVEAPTKIWTLEDNVFKAHAVKVGTTNGMVTEIVSGGARGVDTCAREYALAKGIKLTEFLPEYDKYGRGAPLRRNITIIEYADLVLAFWDGSSHGTKYVIDNCKKRGVPVKVYVPRL